MILIIHIWISVWIIYISSPKQQRNIVQLCTIWGIDSTSPQNEFEPEFDANLLIRRSKKLVDEEYRARSWVLWSGWLSEIILRSLLLRAII